jgi:hypothetical protein
VVLEGVLVTSRLIAAVVFPVYDDAFIIFRYARNLALGRGFVYESGQHVLGVTSPAYGMLLSAFYALGMTWPEVSVAFNLVCDLILLWLVWTTLRRAQLDDVAMVFGILFSVSPMLARASTGGLETGLFLVAVFGAITLDQRGYAELAVFAAAASIFVRPEGMLLLVLLLLKSLIWNRERLLGLLMITGLTVVPVLVALDNYYGSVVPQSVVAKARLMNSPFGQLVRTLVVPEVFSVALVPLAIVGGARWDSLSGPVRILALWTGAYLAAYTFARPMIFSWYSVPVQFTLVLLASFGLGPVAKRVGGTWRNATWMALFKRMAVLAPILLWTSVLVLKGPSPVTASVFRPLAEYCQESVEAGATIVASDIGAIGYYCDAHILDTMGLVWPDALHSSGWQDVVERYQPGYVLALATRDAVRTVRDDPAFRPYRVVARFSPSRNSDVSLDPERYPDRTWVQDYLLLKREER